MPRLFVSVDLPDRLSAEFAAVQEPLRDRPGLRPTDPAQAHCTLKFLGDVADDRVDDVETAVEDAVEAADVGPFEVAVGGVGAFPSREYISVVWAGVREGGERLETLASAVERETVARGFDPADHEFTPHFTLARMDDARSKDHVREFLETDPTVGAFTVETVRVTASTLTESGPEYETVAAISL